MRNMVGVAGRMFTTLAQGNVNIEMISQGANEINISCVLDARDAIKALNLIHQSCLQIKPEGPKGRGSLLRGFSIPQALTSFRSGTLVVLIGGSTCRTEGRWGR